MDTKKKKKQGNFVKGVNHNPEASEINLADFLVSVSTESQQTEEFQGLLNEVKESQFFNILINADDKEISLPAKFESGGLSVDDDDLDTVSKIMNKTQREVVDFLADALVQEQAEACWQQALEQQNNIELADVASDTATEAVMSAVAG